MANNQSIDFGKKLLILGVISVFAVVFSAWMNASDVFAEDEVYVEVYNDNQHVGNKENDEEKRSITGHELEQIAVNEAGDRTYDYSGFNTYPSPDKVTDAKGPTIKGILDYLGINYDNNTTIEFVGNDGASQKIIAGQLFETRYYFPNISNEAGRKGQAPLSSSYESKEEVPAIIALNKDGRLLFGQTAPTEQNFPAFIKYIARNNPDHPGTIKISHEDPDKWSSITSTDPASSSTVLAGTKITFDKTVDQSSRDYWIYFTVDGSEPSCNSALYNYNSFNFGNSNQAFQKPTLSGDRDVTVKAVVTGYGKLDSDVSTFAYCSVAKPAMPTLKTTAATSYQSAKLNWSAVSGAAGYEIYRSAGSGYSLCKKVLTGSTASWIDTGLKTGARYYYKVRSYKVVNGTSFYSDFTTVKNALPTLAKSNIKSIASKKKKITLKWTTVPGANGYQIYRSTKSNKNFKLIKTQVGAGKVSFVNKKLKKKRVFYYKVRPYRNVAGKKVYGGFSSVKKIKVK